MQNSYANFLEFRAAQRRLTAKFSRPRGLVFHTLVFIAVMSLIWAYGSAWKLWLYRDNFIWPVLVGLIWSILLAAHAIVHYHRSPANMNEREMAVETEMRQFLQRNDETIDDHMLFELHQKLETDLERQGRWSIGLVAFALVNVISWVISAINMGTSWGFQMTPPLAMICIGGVSLFLMWQRQRRSEYKGWFTRLPLRHIVVYGVGVIGLWLAGTYRLINSWDADTLIQGWSIVLLIHTLLAVVVIPIIGRFQNQVGSSETADKQKRHDRLVLNDDGELRDPSQYKEVHSLSKVKAE